MAISELLARQRTLSFEFFPPKTPRGQKQLNQAIAELSQLDVSFVSVTTGAGGSSHEPTKQQVLDLVPNHSFEVMAHVTCAQHSQFQIASLMDDYEAGGVENILALAGDPPQDGSSMAGEFSFASELVEEIRRHPHSFAVGVAAHPEVHPRSASRESDRRFLAQKLSAADFAITQFFFDASYYFRLVEELAALGCGKPVIPGVMPVTSPGRVKHFADMNGTEIDSVLWERLEQADAGDKMSIAVEAAHKLCAELLQFGAPGLHFYTMNQSEASLRLCRALGL